MAIVTSPRDKQTTVPSRQEVLDIYRSSQEGQINSNEKISEIPITEIDLSSESRLANFCAIFHCQKLLLPDATIGQA